MGITKAVITAAGRGLRQYPASDTVQKAMLPLVDRDGLTKPVLQIIAEEAFESGIEEICVVSAPGDEEIYRRHFRSYAEMLRSAFVGISWAEEQAKRLVDLEARIQFAVQPEAEGYGHAVWCARPFVGNQPFLLLLGDHIYVSRDSSDQHRRCARPVLDLAESRGCSVSAVQATREHLIHQYGTVAGKKIGHDPNIYQIEKIIEKPTPTAAELQLHVPGLRAGYYLCFFGIHVLTPSPPRLIRWPVKSLILLWKPKGPAITWVSNSDSWMLRSLWPWPEPIVIVCWPACLSRWCVWNSGDPPCVVEPSHFA